VAAQGPGAGHAPGAHGPLGDAGGGGREIEAGWDREVDEEANRAWPYSPRPDGDGLADLRDGRRAATLPPCSADGVTVVQAINRALHHAMDNDPRS